MLRRGLTAAGLLIAAVVLVAGGRAEPARTQSHTCGALDRQFVHAAALTSATLAAIGQDYQSGALAPKQAIEQARDAELGLAVAKPRDASLKLAGVLMRGMVSEYTLALRAQWKGGDPGAHMYRSYSYANYAHQVLKDAQPALAKSGCDVAALL